MKNNLVKKVAELERAMLQIKKVQKAQNDSYKFYVYQTENLWNQLQPYTKVYIEFVPEMKKKEEVMCRFFAEDGSAVQYYATVETDPKDFCKATFFFNGYNGSGNFPDFMKFAYVGCYTNCAGHLSWHT